MTEIVPAELVSKVLPDEALEATAACDTILISPHRRLRLMPLHAIRLREGSLLIERQAVHYLPTLAMLPFARRETPPADVLLLGCAQDNFRSPALAGVPDEIKGLTDLWSRARPGAVTSIELAASDDLEGRKIPIGAWSRYGIVHLACHGVFDSRDPLGVSLRLGSEGLRASEWFGARLTARVVSLGACDVGQHGDRWEGLESASDEWLGLVLPLFYAGARNLVVSLWKANSEQATQFMQALHGALADGQDPAQAFRLAARDLKDLPIGLWANWYLVGFPADQDLENRPSEEAAHG
jgi:CHAT domain-containing protein